MPTSIIPLLIEFAISTHACRPELHCLFRLLTAAETGKPAAKAAALNSVAPPPGGNTDPTAISSTRPGSIFERSMSDLKAPTSISAAAVSLKPPRPPFVNAVRRQAVTTIWNVCQTEMEGYGREEGVQTSSGFFWRRAARPLSPSVGAMLLPEPARWPETWPSLFCAVDCLSASCSFQT
jgi:hypothetical protein